MNRVNVNNNQNEQRRIDMKTRTHRLSEQEQEQVKLLVQECESTRDIQEKLKRLFAGTI